MMDIRMDLSIILLFAAVCQAAPAKGPLVIHPENPRYFMVKNDPNKKAVYLTGSHYWYNLQDRFIGNSNSKDYISWPEYLKFLRKHNHNFVRGWSHETAMGKVKSYSDLWIWDPMPYDRTGPGLAADGKPKFDLTKFNQVFFDQIRKRAIELGKEGIYISIMLFQGWNVDVKIEGKYANDPWIGHPFNKANNINGINGDMDNDGEGLETHQLDNPQITKLQEKYVKKMIDTLNDLDNIMWEISNESHGNSGPWQHHMAKFIKRYEKKKPKQHLVGITAYDIDNQALFNSPADWISPNAATPTDKAGYHHDPPDAKGKKIIMSDTDHLWGIGGNHSWVWRSFTRGLHPIFMDPLYVSGSELKNNIKLRDPAFPTLRKAMGHTLMYANKVNLAKMTPRNDLSTSTFCLANPGIEYIVYQPNKIPYNLQIIAGTYNYEWFDPQAGKVIDKGNFTATNPQKYLTPPANCIWDSVLYLKRVKR